jgi:hypothetical protein
VWRGREGRERRNESRKTTVEGGVEMKKEKEGLET